MVETINTSKNLWTGINTNEVSVVKTLLQTQATYLGQISKNIVEASVRTTLIVDEEANGFMDMPKVSHCFDIITPLLGYSRFTLFCVEHLVGKEFPLTFHSEYSEKELKKCPCKNIEKFNSCLEKVLTSEKTIQLINNIIAQSI